MKHTTANKLIKGLSLLTGTIALTGAVGQQGTLLGATDSSSLDRTVLPIKEPTYPESTVLDARDAKPPPLKAKSQKRNRSFIRLMKELM